MATLVSVNDTGRFRRALASFLGRQQQVQVLSVYGVVSSPPPGSQMVIWPMMGDESNQIGIADAQPLRPIKDLKPGEVALVNYLTGAAVFMREDGSIHVESSQQVTVEAPDVTIKASGSVTVDSPQVSFSGNVEISGTLTVAGINMNTHTHPDAQGGMTGPPQ
jgi:phage baseplate assembly protein V